MSTAARSHHRAERRRSEPHRVAAEAARIKRANHRRLRRMVLTRG